MSDHQRARRLDQRTAERLLGGAPASRANGAAGGHDALRALLSAAAGPPRPGELAGEDAAAAAFLAARARPEARRSRWSAVPRYATVKVAVVAATLAAFGGGVAVAASTGHLPGQSPAPASSRHPAPKHSWNGGDRLPSRSPSPTVVPRATPPRHPKPSPSPKGKPQHARTTPPGQANSRSPKAKKTHPNNGQSNGSSGSGNGSSSSKGSGDGRVPDKASAGTKDHSRVRGGGNAPRQRRPASAPST